MILPMLRSALTSGAYFAPEWRASLGQGVDLLGFFVPSEISMLLGNWTYPIYAGLYGGHIESIAFPGFVSIACVVLAFRYSRSRLTWLLAVLGTLFAVLALGDRLHVAGPDGAGLFGTKMAIPLPGALLKVVPILNMVRVASRFVILCQLAITMLAALGLGGLFARIPILRRSFVKCALVILMFLDLSVVPYHTSETKHGRLYEILRDIPTEFSMMHIPFGVGDPMHYYGENTPDKQHWTAAQVVHQKPVLETLVVRIPLPDLDRFQHSPLISAIVSAQSGMMNEATLEELTPDVLKEQLRHFNLKVIIVHRTMLNSRATEQLTHLFSHLGFRQLYADQEVAVIETPLGPSLEGYVPKPDRPLGHHKVVDVENREEHH
jgi:hypothetical protein